MFSKDSNDTNVCEHFPQFLEINNFYKILTTAIQNELRIKLPEIG